MENEIRNEGPQSAARTPEYDPPQVERVMSADELTREVHYAGAPASPGGTFG